MNSDVSKTAVVSVTSFGGVEVIVGVVAVGEVEVGFVVFGDVVVEVVVVVGSSVNSDVFDIVAGEFVASVSFVLLRAEFLLFVGGKSVNSDVFASFDSDTELFRVTNPETSVVANISVDDADCSIFLTCLASFCVCK